MTDRTLILLRHAKSDWPDGVDDADRPLAPRGRKDAPAAGRWLREHAPDVEAVSCSPALRTLQTWQLLRPELAGTPALHAEPLIYAATVRDLLTVVRRLPAHATTALVIGHNPGLSELVAELAGKRIALKTSGLAVLRADRTWSAADHDWAKLTDTAKPRG
jgi:phosphohistidine phosphatase